MNAQTNRRGWMIKRFGAVPLVFAVLSFTCFFQATASENEGWDPEIKIKWYHEKLVDGDGGFAGQYGFMIRWWENCKVTLSVMNTVNVRDVKPWKTQWNKPFGFIAEGPVTGQLVDPLIGGSFTMRFTLKVPSNPDPYIVDTSCWVPGFLNLLQSFTVTPGSFEYLRDYRNGKWTLYVTASLDLFDTWCRIPDNSIVTHFEVIEPKHCFGRFFPGTKIGEYTNSKEEAGGKYQNPDGSQFMIRVYVMIGDTEITSQTLGPFVMKEEE